MSDPVDGRCALSARVKKMLRSLFGKILLLHTIFLGSLGCLMYYKPKILLGLFRSDTFQTETLAVVNGWGAALLTLAVITLQMSFYDNYVARQHVYRALFLGWMAIVHGSWHMITNTTYHQGWNNTLLIVLAVIESLFALLTFYFGFFYSDETQSHKKNN